MNHFLLPDKGGDTNPDLPLSASLRYGSYSMEQLINGILSAGGRRERLEVKIFGGANVLAGLRGIGHQNADFIERFLTAEGFRVSAADLRGTRSEEHTSELQSLMRHSYADFCLKKQILHH